MNFAHRDAFYTLDGRPGIYYRDGVGQVWQVGPIDAKGGTLTPIDALPADASRVDESALDPPMLDFCRQVRAAIRRNR